MSRPERQEQKMSINLQFTAKEISLLTSLVSDQLFRREFIDPKLPGYKVDADDLRLAKQLVERLRQATEQPVSSTAPIRRQRASA